MFQNLNSNRIFILNSRVKSFVISPREAEAKTVAVRERGKGDVGQASLTQFMAGL